MDSDSKVGLRIHQDSYMVEVMHVQIVGEKRWYVMGPNAELHYNEHGHLDLQALCDNPDTQLMQCVLKPGEVWYSCPLVSSNRIIK